MDKGVRGAGSTWGLWGVALNGWEGADAPGIPGFCWFPLAAPSRGGRTSNWDSRVTHSTLGWEARAGKPEVPSIVASMPSSHERRREGGDRHRPGCTPSSTLAAPALDSSSRGRGTRPGMLEYLRE